MAGNKPTLKNEIVRKYLKKFPTTPNAALARKIFKENPLTFKDAETIRTMIRTITGNIGLKNRNVIIDKSLISKPKPCNPYNLPNSYESDFTIFDIKQSRILILSDLHFPYQNNRAIELALDYGKENKVDCILINGDLIDFANISRHDKDWRSRSINDEFESVRTFLKSLRLNFPNTRIIYKHGNHDERWEKFLYVKAPEIFDVADFQLEVLLRLGELKIETVKDKRPIRLGKLTVLHGHELMGMGGVNPARATFTKTLEDTLVGHYHRTSSHSEPTMNGKTINVYSQGCLCELHPMFMPLNKWCLGFSFVELNIKTNDYILHNKMIINGIVR
jgi:predicted phosphodiesterase